MSGKAKTTSVDFGYLNDNKVEKGKKKVLEATKNWKGGSHTDRREAQREEKIHKAMKKHAKSAHPEKVSWKKKAAGFAAVFFICGVGVFQFLSTVFGFIVGNGVQVVDVLDTPKLKSVLFSGDPWLVHCVTNETQNQRLPSVLEESSLKRSLGVQTAVLHCWDKTESGRSVAQRFKLRTSPPLAFVVANGNSPRVINLVGISKPEELEKRIKPALKIEISRIDALKKWPSLCTSRRTCVVIGHRQNAQRDTALNLLRPLSEYHRSVKFVTLDTSFWQLKLDEAVLQTRPGKEGESRGADVLCLAKDNEGNGTSGTFMAQLTSSSASAFVKACESRTGLVSIPTTPRIMARPSKPKKVTPEKIIPRRRDPPRTQPRPVEKDRGNVDRVGSRAKMEEEAEEEALFEAIDEAEQNEDDVEQGDEEEDEGEEGSEEEVEL